MSESLPALSSELSFLCDLGLDSQGAAYRLFRSLPVFAVIIAKADGDASSVEWNDQPTCADLHTRPIAWSPTRSTRAAEVDWSAPS